MLVLAFDTTSEFGGAGIFRDAECLASLANEGPANVYSVSLFEMVERLFGQARDSGPKLSLRDVELFAVANGPGSFTGIRVGLAAAQAWAKAFERPARGVSVLEAMVDEGDPETDWAVPILDARRGEFYLSLYRRAEQAGVARFVAEGEGLVLKPEALATFLAENLPSGAAVTCLVRAGDRSPLELANTLLKSTRCRKISGTLVAAIARLALRAQGEGEPPSPAELDACYIRRSDAELNWKE
ncbi:MAG TPA: tRNA (adenosine(37)-N6)-threonylcarbamoyltransferase complex dimerization subunit type 1 TsaB [Terriglobia bacterium]|nr:tRNA (adenosine(37)-N6)-threonylcarbamoyltransferase complex dimerization subunit type 1 TsaB [Terriglobia bacterium]